MTVVIIPTYNEKENISSLIEKIFSLLPDIYILVVDDNSPDGTAEVVKGLQKIYPRLAIHQRTNNKGFGRSYLDGFREILNEENFEIVVMMDADFSHDPKEIPEMIKSLSNYDIVIGSRYVSGGEIENWKWSRRLLSRFANFYVRAILGVPIRDMTTGFICLRKKILKSMDLSSVRSDGYAFLVELKYKMFKSKYKILEHPIVFVERREGQSKMSFKNIWEAIFLPWKLRFLKK